MTTHLIELIFGLTFGTGKKGLSFVLISKYNCDDGRLIIIYIHRLCAAYPVVVVVASLSDQNYIRQTTGSHHN